MDEETTLKKTYAESEETHLKGYIESEEETVLENDTNGLMDWKEELQAHRQEIGESDEEMNSTIILKEYIPEEEDIEKDCGICKSEIRMDTEDEDDEVKTEEKDRKTKKKGRKKKNQTKTYASACDNCGIWYHTKCLEDTNQQVEAIYWKCNICKRMERKRMREWDKPNSADRKIIMMIEKQEKNRSDMKKQEKDFREKLLSNENDRLNKKVDLLDMKIIQGKAEREEMEQKLKEAEIEKEKLKMKYKEWKDKYDRKEAELEGKVDELTKKEDKIEKLESKIERERSRAQEREYVLDEKLRERQAEIRENERTIEAKDRIIKDLKHQVENQKIETPPRAASSSVSSSSENETSQTRKKVYRSEHRRQPKSTKGRDSDSDSDEEKRGWKKASHNSNKRRKEHKRDDNHDSGEKHRPNPWAKQREQEKRNQERSSISLGVIADSTMKIIMNDPETAQVWCNNGWNQNVNVRRGRNARQLQQENFNLDSCDTILIATGTNDLGDCEGLSRREQRAIIEDLEDATQSMIQEHRDANRKVILVGPSPRAGVPWDLANKIDKTLEVVAWKNGADYISITEEMKKDIREGETLNEVRETWLLDGVHVQFTYLRFIMQQVVAITGAEWNVDCTEGKMGMVELEDQLHGKCYRCAKSDHPTRRCKEKTWCKICNKDTHNDTACINNFIMCKWCGNTGHRRETCPMDMRLKDQRHRKN